MDTRLSIAMTLVLAINVFQVVLVENTPATGYLPLLTLFTVLNTVLLVMHGGHSILIAQAHKVFVARRTLKGYEKEIVNNTEGMRAVVHIQRAIRRARNRREWRMRRTERYERSFEARVRRWWAPAGTAPAGGDGSAAPRLGYLTGLRRRSVGSRGKAVPPQGAMLSGVTVRSEGANGSHGSGKANAQRVAEDFILSIDAAPLKYDTQMRACEKAFYGFVDFWAVYGEFELDSLKNAALVGPPRDPNPRAPPHLSLATSSHDVRRRNLLCRPAHVAVRADRVGRHGRPEPSPAPSSLAMRAFDVGA